MNDITIKFLRENMYYEDFIAYAKQEMYPIEVLMKD